MLLIAPAVGFYDPSIGSREDLALLEGVSIPPGIPTEIYAGTQDQVIPLAEIQAMVERSPKEQVQLYCVEDEHSMNKNLEVYALSLKRLRDGL